MVSIILIIILLIISVVIYRQFLKESFVRTAFRKLNSTQLTIAIRLFYYVLLAALSIVLPYIITILFIITTGDRFEGMKLAIIPGLATVHTIFGLIFIRDRLLQKLLLTVLFTVLALILVWLSLTNEIINTGLDKYYFWDLAINNFLAGLFVWEIYFQISNRLRMRIENTKII